jgi:hypothetical protein
MGHCRDCHFWTAEYPITRDERGKYIRGEPTGWGWCRALDDEDVQDNLVMVYSGAYAESEAEVKFHGNFGCILFEE